MDGHNCTGNCGNEYIAGRPRVGENKAIRFFIAFYR